MNYRMRSIGCMFIFFVSLSAIAYAGISTVALSGQSAAGVDGTSFSAFSASSVNSAGEIAFMANLSDGGQGVFKLSRGQLSLVALSGQQIGNVGLTLGSIGDPIINDSGSIAFISHILGGSSRMQGVFIATGTSIRTVLDTSTQVPGIDQIISSFTHLQFNSSGEIAVSATFLGVSGASILVVPIGTVTNVIPDATSSFSMNNNGGIAYLGMDGGLHLFSGGISRLVATNGQSIPNTSIMLNTLQDPTLNDRGEIVFVNGITSYIGGFYSIVNNAVVKWNGGLLEKIASDIDIVPEYGSARLANYFHTPLIDDSGRVFFITRLSTNTNENVLLCSDKGNLSILAQEGEMVEGAGRFTFLGSPNANSSGILTFTSNLDNGGTGIFQLNAILTQTYFPQIADGIYDGQWSWRTVLNLSNRDTSGPASVSVDFAQEDGTPMNVTIQSVTDSHFSFTMPTSGSLQVETSGTGNLKTGWAKVQSDKRVSGIAIYSFYDAEGHYVSEVGVPAASTLTAFSLFVESHANTNTGIALANPNPSPAQATLTLRDSQGQAVGVPVNWDIPANGHTQKYLTELFPGVVPPDFSGTLDIASPLAIIGMNLRQREQFYTSLPLIQ